MSSSPLLTWVDDVEFTCGSTTFRATPFDRFRSTPDRFCVVKRPDLVEKYARLLAEHAPRRIVELGVCEGGSTALLVELTEPEQVMAVDISETRVEALDVYLATKGLSERVAVHYGVDQSDTATLLGLVNRQFGDEPLDLVVDDASHHLDLTRASFDALFPRLRPGGLYVIEDWSWAHLGYGAQRPTEEPLTTLVFEVVMAVPSSLGLIDDVHIDRDWAVIRRGQAPLDPQAFSISYCYSDRGRRLVTALGANNASNGH